MREDLDLPIEGAVGPDEGLTVLSLLEQLKKDRDKQKRLIDEARMRERIVLGEQWRLFAPDVETTFSIDNNPLDGSISENLLYPNVLTYGARINQGRLSEKAFPVHSTKSDVSSAQGADAVLEYERRQCDEDDLLADAAFLAQCHGDVFFYPVWDESRGPFQVRRQKVDEIGPMFDPTGEPVMEEVWEYGGVSEEVVPATDYWTDLVDEYDRASYVVVQRTIDLSTAMRRLTAAGFADVKPNSDSVERNPMDLDVRGVETFEIWSRPGARFEPGLFALVIGTYVCKSIAYPYEHGELPGGVWKIQKVRGSPRGKTHVADAVHQQKLVNVSLRAILRRADVAGDVSTLGPSQQIDAMKISGRRLIPTDLPQEKDLRFVSGDDIPRGLFEVYERARRALQDVFGQNEATATGGDPSQTQSGEQLKIASALDSQKLMTARRGLEKARLRVAKQKISLDRQYWENARMIRVIGPDGVVDAQYLSGADLQGADIALEIVSGSMYTHVANERYAEEGAQAGFTSVDAASEQRHTGLRGTVGESEMDDRIDGQAMKALRGQITPPLPNVDPRMAISKLQEILHSPLADNGNAQAISRLIAMYQQALQQQAMQPRQASNGPGRQQPSKQAGKPQQSRKIGATKMAAEQAQPEGIPQ